MEKINTNFESNTNDAKISIVETDRKDFLPLSQCLARAFYDDPVSLYLFPKTDNRMASLQKMYLFVLRRFSVHGIVYAENSLKGVAVWQAPSPPKLGFFRECASVLPLLWSVRPAMSRLRLVGDVVTKAHIREPHWYLAAIGTEPSHQGQGIGSALLTPILWRCDETKMPAYLESSNEANIPFYQSHGFKVIGELEVPRGPKLWAMFREPRL